MPDTRKPTRDEILAMPAGPEMDRLVAIAVGGDLGLGRQYSTRMLWAWKLAEEHRIGVVPARNLTENRDGWAASRFTGPDALFDNLDMASQIELFEEWVYGDTAPHAICRALLLGECDG